MRPTPLVLALLAATTTTQAQWQLHDAHTTADLRGIDNVGGGVAWASGTDGTILRTEDAGFVWQLCAKPPGGEHLDFRAIQAFDNNTAIIMSSGKGDLSRLYKTTDGCQTWTLLFTNPDKDGFWDALQFEPAPNPGAPPSTRSGRVAVSRVKTREDYGVVIGDPVDGTFPIFESADQGSAWDRWTTVRNPKTEDKRQPPAARMGESLFAASNQSLTVWGAEWEFIFVTGGVSSARMYYGDMTGFCQELGGRCTLKFKHLDLPQFHASTSSGAFAIASRDYKSYFPLRLMIVGGDYQKPDAQGTAVFVSSRDGAHMPLTSYFDVTLATTPPHGYRSAVAYDAATKTWITVGPNGTDISTDDGRNWRALKPDPKFNYAPDADQHWNALSLPTPSAPTAASAPSAPPPSNQQSELAFLLSFPKGICVSERRMLWFRYLTNHVPRDPLKHPPQTRVRLRSGPKLSALKILRKK